MGVFVLGFLFVIVMPLAEGVLLALLFREMCNRPSLALPLGGRIVPIWWKQHNPTPKIAPPISDSEDISTEVENTEGTPEVPVASAPALDTPQQTAQPVANADSELQPNIQEPVPSGVSVFDGTQNVPENLMVGNVLDAMTMETPAVSLQDFERIVDASARSEDAISDVNDASADDMNMDDLQALADALPGTKIDFSQEIDYEESGEMHLMEKELLGEDFDLEALEQQAQQVKESLGGAATTGGTNEDTMLAEQMLDVREDTSTGTVQVSSPFMIDAVPQFADFAVPQTILPTFSNNWIQEAGTAAESGEEDIAKFCFTEESIPLFARKKKKQG